MKAMRRWLFGLLFAGASAQGGLLVSPPDCSAGAPGTPVGDSTALAALLAGRNAPKAIAEHPAWDAHAASFARAWVQFDQRQSEPIRAFARALLVHDPAAAGPVWYPFSGPDWLYVDRLFPSAHDYVLTGLEPVGALPRLDPADGPAFSASLQGLRQSLNAVLSLSFFRTNDMQVDLKRNPLRGVLPILLTFLGKDGTRVDAIHFLHLTNDARLCSVPAAKVDAVADGDIAALRIDFMPEGDAVLRRLYYFAADLSDQGLAKSPQYLAYVRALAPRAVFVKSASYLMHKPYFSLVRKLILEQASLVLQDDSGVPLRFFGSGAWQRELYGHYRGPIPLFANWLQSDLRAAYAERAQPLAFGIGYRHRLQDSNLQLLRKREPAAAGRTGLPIPATR